MPGVLHVFHDLVGHQDALELGVDVCGAAHPPQHLLGLLRVAALHQGVGRVGQEDAACTALHRRLKP